MFFPSINRIGLIICSTLTLTAQVPGREDLSDFQSILEQPIQVASKRIQQLKEAPADISVLRGQDLLDLGYRTLGDALGGVLGFRTNQDRAYTGLGVRGLYVLGDQNSRVLVLLDGHALNNPAEVGSSKVGEDFGIPMDLVERIEIIRGPASSIYGNNAFLGMVSVVTRDSGVRAVGGGVEVTGNSRGLAGLDGSVGGTIDGMRWRAILSGLHREGSSTQFPELGPETLPASLDQEDRQSAYFKASGPAWTFSGFSSLRKQRLPSAPFNSTIGSPANHYENRLSYGDLRLTPSFGQLATLIRVYGDYNEFRSGFDYDGYRQVGVLGRFTESDPDWGLGLEAQVRTNLSENLIVTLGQETNWHHYNSRAGIDPDNTAVQVSYRLSSSYLQTEWSPTNSFTATGGLQLALFSVNSASQWAASQGSVQYPANTWKAVTPRLALVWQPTAVDILKALYGGGYRNPTLFESYYTDISSFLPNPGLQPERTTNLQVFWVRNWATGIQSQLSASRSRWSHLVEATDLGGGFQQFRNDLDDLIGRALEAEVQGRWGYWVGYAQLGYYRWEQAGNTFPNAARMQGALRLTRHWRNLSFSGEVRQVGGREGGPGVPGVSSATTSRLAIRWEGARFWIRGTLEDAGQGRRTDLVASDYSPITRMSGDGRTVYLTFGFPF